MRSRNHFIGLWLDDAEYRHLTRLCRDSGLSASGAVRKCIMGEQLKPRPPDCYAALLRELSGIGTNINKLAHWANGKGYATQAEIHSAAVLAKQAWQLVKDTL